MAVPWSVSSLDPNLIYLLYTYNDVILNLLRRHILVYPLAVSHYCLCCYKKRFPPSLKASRAQRERAETGGGEIRTFEVEAAPEAEAGAGAEAETDFKTAAEARQDFSA